MKWFKWYSNYKDQEDPEVTLASYSKLTSKLMAGSTQEIRGLLGGGPFVGL